jgi:uncharacterized protein YdeI (YjbR/CyaY-like superfamily)
MAKSFEDYLQSQEEWQKEILALRAILQNTELIEQIKWGIPTYCLGKKHVVGICAFKNYVGMWFHQGVFLKDPAKVLINAQEGVTKALRQWRFNSLNDISPALVKSYIEEAIENCKAGKEVKPEKKALVLPVELSEELTSNPKLAEAFESFTAFKKKEFAEHIDSAKRRETRDKRLQQVIPMILEGIGLNDQYR